MLPIGGIHDNSGGNRNVQDDPIHPQTSPHPRSAICFCGSTRWINSSVWNAGFRAGEIWEDITIFFRRFRVRGWKRIVFELAGEAMTLGTAGFVLMLALAQPAFEATKGDWRNRGDFAVTFTRPLRQRHRPSRHHP